MSNILPDTCSTLQPEPCGRMVINVGFTDQLGLELTHSQRELMSALIFAQEVSPCSAALTMTETSILDNGGEGVEYISTVLPAHRTRCATQAQALYPSHSLLYGDRPAGLEVTFTAYFTNYVRVPAGKPDPVGGELQGTDSKKDRIFLCAAGKEPLVRFTDYHPLFSSEGYWFNRLLDEVPFREESELLSNTQV